jgi:chaperonin GroES
VQDDVPAVKLQRWLQLPNIATEIEEGELSKIASAVCEEYTLDADSRSEWEAQNETALKMAKQVKEEKSYPWPGAANVKFPLLQTAAQQFAARAYPSIVRNDKVVRVNIPGPDQDGQKKARGDYIADRMSDQCLNQMDAWEEDTDTLLHALPIVGNAFRKTYYNPEKNCPCSELVLPDELVVNMDAVDLDSVPRVTQVLQLYPREIEERKRMGLFLDGRYSRGGSSDDDAPEEFLEQHRFWDLDGDGYSEPYIITVHKETKELARIVARYDQDGVEVNPDGSVIRIKAVSYFTHYKFLPAPDGTFYGVGYGSMLGPINETIDTTINQMLDAGHLANTGGGFIGAGLRLKSSSIAFRPGEYKNVPASADDLRKSIVTLSFPGPSPVLQGLLELLISAGKEVANVSELLSGDVPNQQMAASTTLALIEQGHRVYSAIFKRMYRSLKKEFAKLYRLNYLYPQMQMDQQAFAPDMEVIPVADPNTATDMQRLAKAEALLQFAQDPMFNAMAIKRRYIDALSVDGMDELFNTEPPQPDPMLLLQQEGAKAEIAKTKAETIVKIAEIDKMHAQMVELLAEAESHEPGQQLAEYDAMTHRMKAMSQLQRDMNANQGSMGGPPQSGGPQGPQGAPPQGGGPVPGPMGRPPAPGL